MKEIITNQFKNPTGVLGKIAGKIMAYENEELYEWTFDQLSITPNDTLLEVGFGPGEGMHMLFEKYPTIQIDGVDPSEEMVKNASKRNQEQLNRNQLRLFNGTVLGIPNPMVYDKIFSVNSYPLWENQEACIQKIHSLLKENGKLTITVQPRQEEATEEQAHAFAEEIREVLTNTGFKSIKVQTKPLKPCLSINVTAIK